MKKYSLMLFVILVLVGVCCKDNKENQKENIKFTGSFVDTDDQPVPDGKLEIYLAENEKEEPKLVELRFKDGKVEGEIPKADRYVVNVKVKGYGLVSKVFRNSVPDYKYELRKATVLSVSPLTGGIVRDSQNNCRGSYSKRADWASKPLASLPIRLNSAGEVAGFGMSADLKTAYDFHAKSAPCNNGIAVSIPANAIVGSGSLPDSVTVSMSAIDLFSPDGMPGDYSTRMQQGAGFMESFGAFSIEMYDEDENEYNLSRKEGQEAEVTFPTEVLLPNRKDLPESVPLLYYDEKQGEWKREGEAVLDRKRNVYVAKVKHFSAINLDLEKTDPACVRVLDNASDAANAPYKVEVTIPPTGGGTPRVGTNTVQATDLCTDPGVENQFALTRLPQNTDVSIVFFNDPGPVPLATYVIRTGATNAALVDRTKPDCTEMSTLCGTSIINFDTTPVGSQEVLVAGCKRPGSNDILVSIAVNKSVAPAGLPATAVLRITVFASDTESCGEDAADFITLPAPVFVHDTPGNFQVSQYVIPNSELCDTNPPVATKVAVMNAGALVSNDAIVAGTCDF